MADLLEAHTLNKPLVREWILERFVTGRHTHIHAWFKVSRRLAV
jgi:hypothetical protein